MNIDEKLAYIAGWFASDRHIRLHNHSKAKYFLKWTLAIKDKAILEIFSSWFGGNVKTYSYKRELVKGLIDYEIAVWDCSNLILVDYIRSFDWKNKSPKLEDNLMKLYIRGFFEGDGHISLRKKNNHCQINFTNASKLVLQGILEHFQKVLDIPVKELISKPVKENRIPYYSPAYEARVARLIAWYIYKDAAVFLARKAAVANQLFGNYSDPILQFLNIVLIKKTTYLKHNNGFIFRIFQSHDSLISAKMVCKGFQSLGINATPVPYGKGKEKYFGIYIPSSHIHLLDYTQDFLEEEKGKTFPGKSRLLV
jgi:hypothetical protein